MWADWDEGGKWGRRPPPLFLSGKCDYSVCEQAEHPVNADLLPLAASLPWNRYAEADHYVGLQLGPPCVPERCKIADRFSLKTDRWTWQTFGEEDLPGGMTWYTTNLNVDHPRMKLLPFGLNTDGHGTSILPNFLNRPKRRRLYVNFQDNTTARIRAKQHYAQLVEAGVDWVTFRPRVGMPVEQFYDEMADHQFVLCPEGTGLDSYRLWEALYLGCTPVLKESKFAWHLFNLGLPVLLTDRYEFEGLVSENVFGWMDAARVSYWREKLKKEVGA